MASGTLLQLLAATHSTQRQLAAATTEQGEGIQRASPAKRWAVLTVAAAAAESAAAAAAAAAAVSEALAKGGSVIDT